MEFLFFWIIFTVLIGIWASNLGRNVFLCILGSLLLSPMLVAIYLLIAGKSDELYKKCPQCAELVKKEALVCKHCGSKLTKK